MQYHHNFKKNIFFPFLASSLEENPAFLVAQAQNSGESLERSNSQLVMIKLPVNNQALEGFSIVEQPHLSIFQRSADFYHYTVKLKTSSNDELTLRFYFDSELMLPSRTECKTMNNKIVPAEERLPESLRAFFRGHALDRVRYWTPIIRQHQQDTLQQLIDHHQQLSADLNQALFPQEESMGTSDCDVLLTEMILLCQKMEKFFPHTVKKFRQYQEDYYKKIQELLSIIPDNPVQENSDEAAAVIEEEQRDQIIESFPRTTNPLAQSSCVENLRQLLSSFQDIEERMTALRNPPETCTPEELLDIIHEHYYYVHQLMLETINFKTSELRIESRNDKRTLAQYLLCSTKFLGDFDTLSESLAQKLLEKFLDQGFEKSLKTCINRESINSEQNNQHSFNEMLSLFNLNTEPAEEVAEETTAPGISKTDRLANVIDRLFPQLFGMNRGGEAPEFLKKEICPQLMQYFGLSAAHDLLSRVMSQNSQHASGVNRAEHLAAILSLAHRWEFLDESFLQNEFSVYLGEKCETLTLAEYIARDFVSNPADGRLLGCAIFLGCIDLSQEVWSPQEQLSLPLGSLILHIPSVPMHIFQALAKSYGDDISLITTLFEKLSLCLERASPEVKERFENDLSIYQGLIAQGGCVRQLLRYILPPSREHQLSNTSLEPCFPGKSVIQEHMINIKKVVEQLHSPEPIEKKLQLSQSLTTHYDPFMGCARLICAIAEQIAPEAEFSDLRKLFKSVDISLPPSIIDGSQRAFSSEQYRDASEFFTQVIHRIVRERNPQYCAVLEKFHMYFNQYFHVREALFSLDNQAVLYQYERQLLEAFNKKFNDAYRAPNSPFPLSDIPHVEKKVFLEVFKKLYQERQKKNPEKLHFTVCQELVEDLEFGYCNSKFICLESNPNLTTDIFMQLSEKTAQPKTKKSQGSKKKKKR